MRPDLTARLSAEFTVTTFDSNSPEGTLIVAVLAGERQAYAHIVARYENPLLNAARNRLGRREWAEDAVQETFLCVLKWLHTYDSQYSFRTWLWTILLNQCTRLAAKQARQPQSFTQPAAGSIDQPENSHSPASGEASPCEQLLQRESAERLHSLLARLPASQADSLRLRFFGGLKFQEIADAMGCSLSSAKIRVRQGLTQLSAWLREADCVPSAGAADHLVGDSPCNS